MLCILTWLILYSKKDKYEDCTEKCFEGTSILSDFATVLKVISQILASLCSWINKLIIRTITFILQSFKPQVHASEDDNDLEKCFERCGRGKDVDDADDIEECQLDCIEEQVVNGRSRSSIGPNGKFYVLMVYKIYDNGFISKPFWLTPTYIFYFIQVSRL